MFNLTAHDITIPIVFPLIDNDEIIQPRELQSKMSNEETKKVKESVKKYIRGWFVALN